MDFVFIQLNEYFSSGEGVTIPRFVNENIVPFKHLVLCLVHMLRSMPVSHFRSIVELMERTPAAFSFILGVCQSDPEVPLARETRVHTIRSGISRKVTALQILIILNLFFHF